MCDCDATRFWDGTTCSVRSTYGGACVTTSGNTNYACKANSNLQCSFGQCVCLTPYPTWNAASGVCQ